MWEEVYVFFKAWLDPLPLSVVLLAAATLRRKRWLLIVVTCGIYLAGIKPVSQSLAGVMERGCPVAAPVPSGIETVVILGAGVTGWEGRERVEPSAETALRLTGGLVLYLESGARTLVLAGGAQRQGRQTEAQVMGRLARAFGVADDRMILENRSRNTRGHVEELQHLPNVGQGRMAVVTSAVHMRRALMNFERVYPDVVAYPIGCAAANFGRSVFHYIPSVNYFRTSTLALYEMAGYIKDRFLTPVTGA